MGTLEINKEFAFNLIYMQDQLYYYALQLTENREDARDLVQETSYKALKNKSKLMNDKNIRAWLYTILRNTYINYLRSGHNRQVTLDKSDINQHILNTPSPLSDTPDAIYDRKELHNIITMLPGTYGKPLQMFISGYSYKEIAEKMHIPIGTVKSRIHLGKKKIQKAYIT